MRDQDNRKAPSTHDRRAPAGKPVSQRDGPLPALMALQRSVGNTAVVQMLRRAAQAGAQERHRQEDGRDEQLPAQRFAVHDVLRSGGHPLDEATRTDMETRFGEDFSDVRIHDDPAAKASAAELQARAYTSGAHVVIGKGGADRHTLAHELTHVIQQRQGPVSGTDTGSGVKLSHPSDRYERAAEANATRIMHSHSGTITPPSRNGGAGREDAAGTADRSPRANDPQSVVQRYRDPSPATSETEEPHEIYDDLTFTASLLEGDRGTPRPELFAPSWGRAATRNGPYRTDLSNASGTQSNPSGMRDSDSDEIMEVPRGNSPGQEKTKEDGIDRVAMHLANLTKSGVYTEGGISETKLKMKYGLLSMLGRGAGREKYAAIKTYLNRSDRSTSSDTNAPLDQWRAEEISTGGGKLEVHYDPTIKNIKRVLAAVAESAGKINRAGYRLPSELTVYIPKYDSENRVTKGGRGGLKIERKYSYEDLKDKGTQAFFIAPRTVFTRGMGSNQNLSDFTYVMIHELSHAVHSTMAKPSYEALKDTAIPNQDIPIAKKVSNYATTNSREFIAELITKRSLGKKFGADVMELYDFFEGPNPG